MPSPAKAERTQARKRAFIPVWPVIGAIAAVVIVILLLR